MIDYEKMNRVCRRHKAALTRAQNTKDPQKVLKAATAALSEFEAMGSYPDCWSLWQRAKDDAELYIRLKRPMP